MNLQGSARTWEKAGVAAVKAAEGKIRKYLGKFDPGLYEFTPLILDTGGRLDTAFHTLVREVAEHASSNTNHSLSSVTYANRFVHYWKSRICFAAAKGFVHSGIENTRRLFSCRHPPAEFQEVLSAPWIRW